MDQQREVTLIRRAQESWLLLDRLNEGTWPNWENQVLQQWTNRPPLSAESVKCFSICPDELRGYGLMFSNYFLNYRQLISLRSKHQQPAHG